MNVDVVKTHFCLICMSDDKRQQADNPASKPSFSGCDDGGGIYYGDSGNAGRDHRKA
jgi:hypothetical protein